MYTSNSIVYKTEQASIGDRIRNLRISLNMSVRSLASKAGFSPSFISQVETGQVSPSISSLERIASILGLTLAGFFIGEGTDNPVVIRSDNRQEITSSWSRSHIEALMSSGVTRHLEAVMITVAPGGRSGKQPASHSGEEFALVYDGKISLTLGAEIHTLQRGDTVSFSSEVPHLWENPALENAQVVIVSPRFTH